jgi:hypothetical protein
MSNSAGPIRRRKTGSLTMTTGLLAALVFASSLGCAPRYLAHNFATDYQAHTKVVALAPLANLTSNPEGTRAGEVIREAIFHELIRRQDRYTVTIQDIAETDKRIHDSGMSDSAASRLPAPDFCRLVGVDAVMSGSVTRYDKKGVAGQIATAILFSSATGSEVKADVAVYDGTDGKMTFQHDIEKAGGFLSSPDALRKSVGATVAGKFPYKKRKSH